MPPKKLHQPDPKAGTATGAPTDPSAGTATGAPTDPLAGTMTSTFDDRADIDTGTGGFSIDGELNTFDVGASDDRPSYGTHSKGAINVNDLEVKDVSRKTKVTLAQYLGKKTINNSYSVDQDGYKEISLSDSNGLVQPVVQSENAQQFSRDLPSSFSSAATTLSNFSKGRQSLNAIKGLEIPNGPVDGNRLLQQATVDNAGATRLSETSPVAPYTSAVLSQNRFTSDRRMPNSPLRRYQKQEQPQGSPYYGHYASNTAAPAGTQDYDVERLSQVGPALTLRAGLEIGSTVNGYNPSSGAAEVKALLPGSAQLGVNTVDRKLLDAADVLDELYKDESGERTPNVVDIGPSGRSWGSLNNVLDPFSGITSLGMQALSLAMILSLDTLFELLGLAISSISNNGKSPSKDNIGRYTLGSYNASKKTKGGLLGTIQDKLINEKLRIYPTSHPFGECVKVGVSTFFGIDTSSIGSRFSSAALSGLDNAGYNVVVCRSIVRSGVTIVEEIKKIGGNPLSVVKGVVGLIDVLAGSKILSAMNVFAQLGDAVLSRPKEWNDNNADVAKVSETDGLPNLDAVKKSRLKDSLKLAWASNRASAQLLIPSSVLPALVTSNMDSPTFGIGNSGDDLSVVKQNIVNTNRLSAEDVYDFERHLDAEYVPFTFHDIRTNEILSFHAFLDSLTDNLNASYDSVEGIGRIEPVRIYKNTQRKLGLSFHIVSTSLSDFDDMWVKINKLTTLMYPQYTRGRMIGDGVDYKLRQPFSQLVGAAPLVRIRLGDLVRNNYSRFALARLFGMGDPKTIVDKAEPNVNQNTDLNGTVNEVQNYINRIKNGEEKDIDKLGKLKFVAVSGFPLSKVEYNFTFSNQAKWAEVFILPPSVPADFLQIRVLGAVEGKTGVVQGQIELGEDAGDKYKENFEKFKSLVKQFVTAVDGAVYEFPSSVLTPTQKSLSKIIGEKVSKSADAYYKNFGDFMSDDNAIVKSFKTTSGKGLAGFIESMDFDWLGKTSWETSPGRTAPQMCKVTITFAPIHDISPGLDADGFNRAPIYPIGPLAPGKIIPPPEKPKK